MQTKTPRYNATGTPGTIRREGRRALLRHAKAVGIPSLRDQDLAAIIDHRCAEYVKRGNGLPTLRDAASDDYGDPGRLRLAAAIELGRRTLAEPPKRDRLLGPKNTAAYLMPRYGNLPVEHLGALLVDSRHRLLEGGDIILTRGGLDETPASPREVLRAVLLAPTRAFVLWHNHPSGDPTPSEDDVAITRRLHSAAEIVGVDLLDHVIVGTASYYSFKEGGRL